MHGLGNDFVLLDNLAQQHQDGRRQAPQLTPEQIQFIAERQRGIGCDQVLILDPPSDGVSTAYYRIYNRDGSVAAQCGNGARCCIAYLLSRGFTGTLALQTATQVTYGGQLEDGNYWVDMGRPNFAPPLIPLLLPWAPSYQLDSIEFIAVALGNPHAVIQLETAAELDDDQGLAAIAVKLQTAGLFPAGVNVNFCYRLNSSTLQLRTYENGCGFTQACGSGACASAVVVVRDNFIVGPLRVQMPGGMLAISYQGDNVVMHGSATHVFEGEIEL